MRVIILLLACTFVAVSMTRAEDPPKPLNKDQRMELAAKMELLYGVAVRSHQEGNLLEASRALEQGVAFARQLYPRSEYPYGNEHLAVFVRALGATYYQQEKFKESAQLYEEVLATLRKLHKTNRPEMTITLIVLAKSYYALNKPGDAEPLLKEALELRRLHKGIHPDVIDSLHQLADLYLILKRPIDAEPLCKEALTMCRQLYKGDSPEVADALIRLAAPYRDERKFADAKPLLDESLAMHRRIYLNDHADLFRSINELADLFRMMGRPADADPLYREALGMRKRLLKSDDAHTLEYVSELGLFYQSWGWLADAEVFDREALDICRRLYKGDHPRLAACMKDLAVLYRAEGKLALAKPLLEEALEMTKRIAKGDHDDVAEIMSLLGNVHRLEGNRSKALKFIFDSFQMRKRLDNNLVRPEMIAIAMEAASLCQDMSEPALAEVLFRQAIEISRRLGQPYLRSLAAGLHNLGEFYVKHQGNISDAELLFKEALTISKQLYTGDHPDIAGDLYSLGVVYYFQRKYDIAEKNLLDSVDMYKRLIITFAKAKTEGESLTLMSLLPNSRDPYFSATRARKDAAIADRDPTTAYHAVWATKGSITRVSEEHSLRVRATTNPDAADMLTAAAEARRRRADLILTPVGTDADAIRRRDDELKSCEKILIGIDSTLIKLVPALARREKLDAATASDLQQALPADAVLVDYLKYKHIEWDEKSPPGEQVKQTDRYLVFVVTRSKIIRVDLDSASKIELAIDQWREAITTAPHVVSADLPAKVRELVWEPAREQIPAEIKMVYVCPDAKLTRLPWPALPGDKVGTILLEDYTIAMVPHGPFLLDTLWPTDKHPSQPIGLLAVGGVAFDEEPVKPDRLAADSAGQGRSSPLIQPKKGLVWTKLIGAKTEAERLTNQAKGRKMDVKLLSSREASVNRVLAALPKARYAHLATHGFFADAQFRSILRLDPKLFEVSDSGRERVGQGALNPMVMSGLVFAGANLPGTPSRGIATGESLIDLDLSGLELAFLSACETGLGDVADGEGVFCLQRAFHVAGARNVVASLWKVDDAVTAALVGEFYRRLWDDTNPVPPVEALRQAQLAVYKANREQLTAMAVRGGSRGLEPGDKDYDPTKVIANAPIDKDGRNPAVLWAAFILSGPGR